MKSCALFIAAGLFVNGLCMAADARTSFIGVIHDNRCVGPNCATQCPVTKGPKYTLQSGDEAWVLSDQKTPARYTGKKVIVTGKVGADNKLHVVSIAPAGVDLTAVPARSR
jgi:hypothetical protein